MNKPEIDVDVTEYEYMSYMVDYKVNTRDIISYLVLKEV